MSTAFSGDILIKIATGIETRGITFYDIMARSSDNDEVRALFEDLVRMEHDHLYTFQDMAEQKSISTSRPPTGERADYLQSLIDAAVFTNDLIAGEMAAQADTDLKALELAIRAEKDSILFYYEMKEELPQDLSPLLERIIAEEKSHLRQLSGIKKALTPFNNNSGYTENSA